MGAQKTIIQKLHDISDSVMNDPTKTKGKVISDLAIAAILSGIGSTAWEDYMKFIVGVDALGKIDSPAQLARLTFKDDKKDQEWIRRSNVYIVSNAVCGTETGARTFLKVDLQIDEGL